MLKRSFLLGLVLLVAVAGAFALDEAAIEQADALYEDNEPQAAFDIREDVLSTAGNGAERAEVLWRMSRATLDIGSMEEDKGGPADPVLAIYAQGEQYGVQAVEADPGNYLGYSWQSANISKWGKLKGIVHSLFKVGTMRELLTQTIIYEPDHADTYYLLGQMYGKVPGLISFGNKDFAVSLGRKSIDLHEAEFAAGIEDEVEYDYYVQMASHLLRRNWDESKRNREQSTKERNYNNASTPLERGWYYEGVVDIPARSDREEADDILRRTIDALENLSDRSPGHDRQLAEARELWDEL